LVPARLAAVRPPMPCPPGHRHGRAMERGPRTLPFGYTAGARRILPRSRFQPSSHSRVRAIYVDLPLPAHTGLPPALQQSGDGRCSCWPSLPLQGFWLQPWLAAKPIEEQRALLVEVRVAGRSVNLLSRAHVSGVRSDARLKAGWAPARQAGPGSSWRRLACPVGSPAGLGAFCKGAKRGAHRLLCLSFVRQIMGWLVTGVIPPHKGEWLIAISWVDRRAGCGWPLPGVGVLASQGSHAARGPSTLTPQP
jgi:hypothetical protein